KPSLVKFLMDLGLLILVLLVLGQLLDAGFTNFDDNLYVTQNPYVQDGLTVTNATWAFATNDLSNWHPLTWLSLQIDRSVFGPKPIGFHLTNLVLHAASTLLLFHTLCRMTGALWCSWFVAALFAVHPLHVESIAWVSERKDVLSGLFWMLTMWNYV